VTLALVLLRRFGRWLCREEVGWGEKDRMRRAYVPVGCHFCARRDACSCATLELAVAVALREIRQARTVALRLGRSPPGYCPGRTGLRWSPILRATALGLVNQVQ